MLFNEKTLRNNTEYLAERYGIVYAPGFYEEYPWLIPDASANTTEDYEYIADYKGFKSSLKVSPGDEIIVTILTRAGDYYFFSMDNITNEKSVYIKYNAPCCGMYDDDRYELIMKLASGLKDIPNVTIQFFLLYDDELVLRRVNAREDYDAI